MEQQNKDSKQKSEKMEDLEREKLELEIKNLKLPLRNLAFQLPSLLSVIVLAVSSYLTYSLDRRYSDLKSQKHYLDKKELLIGQLTKLFDSRFSAIIEENSTKEDQIRDSLKLKLQDLKQLVEN